MAHLHPTPQGHLQLDGSLASLGITRELIGNAKLWLYPDGWNQKLWGWDAVICCVTSLPGDFDALVISLGRGELGG